MKNIKEHIESFLKQQEFSVRRSKETIKGYKAAFHLLFKFMPQIELADITTETMVNFFEYLQTRERNYGIDKVKSGVKTSTIATYRSKLNAFFVWLVETKVLKANPLNNIEYPEVSYEDRKYLTKQDIEKIFTAIITHGKDPLIRKRNIALFSILLYCGLRKNELINLRIIDINFDTREIKVRAETSKSKRNRTLPLHREAIYALKDYLEVRKSKNYKTEYLFVSHTGDRPLTSHGLKHLVKYLKGKSGVEFHLHRFRHTFSVNILHSGCDSFKLQQLLGHKSLRMTQSYTRALPPCAMRDDIERLNIDKLL